MKLLSFKFTKLNAERKSDNLNNSKLDTKLLIKEIEEVPLTNNTQQETENSPTSEKLLRIKFDYIISYGEDIGSIETGGSLIISLSQGLFKEVLSSWKEKKMPEDFKLTIFNFIFKKAGLKAICLEDQVGLPPHIPLPSLKIQDPSKKE